MLSIVVFGLLMCLVSCVMVLQGERYGRTIIAFSQLPYFHSFEILSRAGFGLALLFAAANARYPLFIASTGILLVAVAVFLLMMGPTRHRRFALWSAKKFETAFRPSGFVTVMLGAFFVYNALPVL